MIEWRNWVLVVIGYLMMGTSAVADDDKMRTIAVSASGHVMAEPDIAMITTGVETYSQSARQALAENSKRVDAVLQAIKGLGIDAKDIATRQFRVMPVYEQVKSSNGADGQRIGGFRVINTAVVTVRDVKKIGDVIDRAAEQGANQFDDIDFTISGLEFKLDEARRDAMRNAIRRAKLYVEAAGAKLGEVVTISEQVIDGGDGGRFYRNSARMAASAPVEPGTQKVGVTVNVVWQLD